MFGRKNCNKDAEIARLNAMLEQHEKQHTKEHWVVIALLAVLIALEIAGYVA